MDVAGIGRRHFPAIGLARVRREGFVSLDAGPAGGTLTTRPLRPGGGQLRLSAAVAPGGEVRVEVQDASGAPRPGFEAAACTPATGDAVRRSRPHAGPYVRWRLRASTAP